MPDYEKTGYHKYDTHSQIIREKTGDVEVTELVVSQVNGAGEFTPGINNGYESPTNMVKRIGDHFEFLAQIANTDHRKRNFDEVPPSSGKFVMKVGAKNKVTRLSTNEFSGFGKRPLTMEEYQQLLQRMSEIGKQCEGNVHLLFASVPVLGPENQVFNMILHVQCFGKTLEDGVEKDIEPEVNVFAKSIPSDIDPLYPNTTNPRFLGNTMATPVFLRSVATVNDQLYGAYTKIDQNHTVDNLINTDIVTNRIAIYNHLNNKILELTQQLNQTNPSNPLYATLSGFISDATTLRNFIATEPDLTLPASVSYFSNFLNQLDQYEYDTTKNYVDYALAELNKITDPNYTVPLALTTAVTDLQTKLGSVSNVTQLLALSTEFNAFINQMNAYKSDCQVKHGKFEHMVKNPKSVTNNPDEITHDDFGKVKVVSTEKQLVDLAVEAVKCINLSDYAGAESWLSQIEINLLPGETSITDAMKNLREKISAKPMVETAKSLQTELGTFVADLNNPPLDTDKISKFHSEYAKKMQGIRGILTPEQEDKIVPGIRPILTSVFQKASKLERISSDEILVFERAYNSLSPGQEKLAMKAVLDKAKNQSLLDEFQKDMAKVLGDYNKDPEAYKKLIELQQSRLATLLIAGSVDAKDVKTVTDQFDAIILKINGSQVLDANDVEVFKANQQLSTLQEKVRQQNTLSVDEGQKFEQAKAKLESDKLQPAFDVVFRKAENLEAIKAFEDDMAKAIAGFNNVNDDYRDLIATQKARLKSYVKNLGIFDPKLEALIEQLDAIEQKIAKNEPLKAEDFELFTTHKAELDGLIKQVKDKNVITKEDITAFENAQQALTTELGNSITKFELTAQNTSDFQQTVKQYQESDLKNKIGAILTDLHDKFDAEHDNDKFKQRYDRVEKIVAIMLKGLPLNSTDKAVLEGIQVKLEKREKLDPIEIAKVNGIMTTHENALKVLPYNAFPVGPSQDLRYETAITCRTVGGQEFGTFVDVCLDHGYKIALENLVSHLRKNPGSSRFIGGHQIITSNSMNREVDSTFTEISVHADIMTSNMGVHSMVGTTFTSIPSEELSNEAKALRPKDIGAYPQTTIDTSTPGQITVENSIFGPPKSVIKKYPAQKLSPIPLDTVNKASVDSYTSNYYIRKLEAIVGSPNLLSGAPKQKKCVEDFLTELATLKDNPNATAKDFYASIKRLREEVDKINDESTASLKTQISQMEHYLDAKVLSPEAYILLRVVEPLTLSTTQQQDAGKALKDKLIEIQKRDVVLDSNGKPIVPAAEIAKAIIDFKQAIYALPQDQDPKLLIEAVAKMEKYIRKQYPEVHAELIKQYVPEFDQLFALVNPSDGSLSKEQLQAVKELHQTLKQIQSQPLLFDEKGKVIFPTSDIEWALNKFNKDLDAIETNQKQDVAALRLVSSGIKGHVDTLKANYEGLTLKQEFYDERLKAIELRQKALEAELDSSKKSSTLQIDKKDKETPYEEKIRVARQANLAKHRYFQAERERLRNKVKDDRKDIIKDKTRIEEIVQELPRLNTEIVEKEKELRDFTSDAEQEQRKLDGLVKDKDSAELQLSEVKDKFIAVTVEIELLARTHDDKKQAEKELQSKMTSLLSDIDLLQRSKDSKEDEIKQFDIKIKDIEANLREVSLKIEEVAAQSKELTTAMPFQEEKYKQLLRNIEDNNTQDAKLGEQITSLSSKCDDAISKIKQAQLKLAECEGLLQHLETSGEKNESLKQNLLQQMDELNRSITQYKLEHSQLDAQRVDLMQQRSKLTDELVLLHSSSESLEHQMNQDRVKIEELNISLQQLESEHRVLTEGLKVPIEIRDGLHSKVGSLTQDIASKKDEVSSINEKHRTLLQEIREGETNLLSKKQEGEDLGDQLKLCQANVQKLSTELESQQQIFDQAKNKEQAQSIVVRDLKLKHDTTLPEEKKKLEDGIPSKEKSMQKVHDDLEKVDEQFQALDLELSPYKRSEKERHQERVNPSQQELDRLKSDHEQTTRLRNK